MKLFCELSMSICFFDYNIVTFECEQTIADKIPPLEFERTAEKNQMCTTSTKLFLGPQAKT